MFQISDKGLALTRGYEGLRLTAYQDCAGVWTIGYGHTGADVHAGLVITEEQAEQLLREDMATAVACVNKCVTGLIDQAEFDALADFAFNAGCHAFQTSTLLRNINAGNREAADAQFAGWDHAGGKVVAGLVRRRHDEAAEFMA